MIIKHRINTIQELSEIPENFGVEIDLRLYMGELVLAHNPFESGDKFESWLEHFHHRIIILNVKEDGLETAIVDALRRKDVAEYFFLDQPFPTFRKTALEGIPTSIRLSEYENSPNLIGLDVQWFWLDCFSGNWDYLAKHSEVLKGHNSKTCVVSPELQGREIGTEPEQIAAVFEKLAIPIDAVCTKFPEQWEGLIK